VAHLEGAAPRLGLPDRQADREAHPAHPRQPSLCRPGCRPDRAWKASLVAAGLKPSSVNSYLSLLGTILNAAVDSDYLSHSPLMRKSRAGRVAAAKNLPVSRREVWVTRGQLDSLGQAIGPRYQALVKVAALTGMRRGGSPRCAGTTCALTAPWTTARSLGQGGCALRGRSAIPGAAATAA
jgi:hypothetical protein